MGYHERGMIPNKNKYAYEGRGGGN